MALPSLLGRRKDVAIGTDAKLQKPAVCKGDDSGKAAPRTYASIWSEAAERFGPANALAYDGEGPEVNFTYNELESRSNRLARNLQISYGVQEGELVVTIAENRPELVTLVLACQKLGAAFVPLATDLKPNDYATILEMYSPRLVIVEQPHVGDGARHQMILLPHYRDGDNCIKYMERSGDASPLEVPPMSGEASLIFSTSGSTGLPKGVVYSDMTMSALCMAPLVSIEAGDKSLLWVPMRGVGATVLMLATLVKGVEQVMVDTYPSGPAQWAPLIEKHKITFNLLFGAAMNQFLQEVPDKTFPHVKNISYGGSCFPPSLIQQSMEQFPNAEFRQGYGMTECMPIAILQPSEHKRAHEATPADLVRMASAGKPDPSAEVFIEDMEKPGSGLPPPPEKNGVGQVCARAPILMKEYFRNPEKTKEAMPDGKYMRTGDVGKIDEDGYLHLLGRMKEIIPTYRGFNIAPRDLEEVLYTHPNVGEAAVVGITHPCGAGDMVVAWVTPKADEQITATDLRHHCEQAGVPAWQMPELFNVNNVQLPTNGCKIARKKLQDTSYISAELLAALDRLRDSPRQELSEQLSRLMWQTFKSIDARGTGVVSTDDLRPIFGDNALAVLEHFRPVGSNSPSCGFDDWTKRLSLMPEEECSAWLLQLGSLRASLERNAVLI